MDGDPRWDWIEVTSFGSAEPEYLKGMCRHREVIPVDGIDGEAVAHLCLTCGTQLPAEWQP